MPGERTRVLLGVGDSEEASVHSVESLKLCIKNICVVVVSRGRRGHTEATVEVVGAAGACLCVSKVPF